MKLFSYSMKNKSSLGVLVSDTDKIVDVNLLSKGLLPSSMLEYLNNFESNQNILKTLLKKKNINKSFLLNINDVVIQAPLQNPCSFRDAYAFRKHVEAGRINRGLEMIPEYDEFPVFYFSNHRAICGPGNVFIQKEYFKKLDFEFEVAIIIGRKGKNISFQEAHKYIAGLLVMNDWSEREVQLKEMKLNLGPAKGKDFCTSIGPCLVTLDELEEYQTINKKGINFNLNMNAYINGKLVSTDNLKNMTWSFSQIIERASLGVDLFPGDIIGSGTCSTGCFLELNLTHDENNWLKVGDEVCLTVDCLGSLKNNICLTQ